MRGAKLLSRTFRTKAMAQDWARKREDEVRSGLYIDTNRAEKTTVQMVLDRYLATMTDAKPASVKKREKSRLKIIGEHLGYRTLYTLSSGDIMAYIQNRLNVVKSDTVRKEINTLSIVLRTTQSLWQIRLPHGNPIFAAKEIAAITNIFEPGQERVRRLDLAELRKIKEVAPCIYWLLIEFALETALRRGELLRISRRDINGKQLHVPANHSKTKTHRVIPLSPRALEIIVELPRYLDNRLFNFQDDYVTHLFKKICKKQGIFDLRFHDLRHEAISRLLEGGLEVHEVAAISGHTNWKTLKRYTHVVPDNIQKKLRRL